MAKTLSNKKKIIVMSALVLLLAVTGRFQLRACGYGRKRECERASYGGKLFRNVPVGTDDDEKRRA